ncbi:hypothetical protein BB561_004144 [Smittium simulii]|uniref:Uncharacterized protein n=1 Tax=Smittium simulii TaxID=133385 RepID=A0A2T9YHZ1_9FUNG|nr:hypothetical protein BB561_004144 [Smittium simulii]
MYTDKFKERLANPMKVHHSVAIMIKYLICIWRIRKLKLEINCLRLLLQFISKSLLNLQIPKIQGEIMVESGTLNKSLAFFFLDQKIILFAIKVQDGRKKLELKSGFYDSSWAILTNHNSNFKKKHTTSPIFSQGNKLAVWFEIATPVNEFDENQIIIQDIARKYKLDFCQN